MGNDGLDLAPRRDVAAGERQTQALGVLVQRPGDVAQGGREVRPVLLSAGGHVVESVPQALYRRSDDVQAAQLLAGVGQVHAHPEALAHGGHGDAIHVVRG